MSSREIQLQQSPYCAFTHIVGKAVVVYPRERSIHRLDEVGTFIWDILEQPHTRADIVARVVEEFDVDPDTAEQDTRQFLDLLVQKHLVEPVSASGGDRKS